MSLRNFVGAELSKSLVLEDNPEIHDIYGARFQRFMRTPRELEKVGGADVTGSTCLPGMDSRRSDVWSFLLPSPGHLAWHTVVTVSPLWASPLHGCIPLLLHIFAHSRHLQRTHNPLLLFEGTSLAKKDYL
jgi:hypothetical protein